MSKSIQTGERFRWIDLENPSEEELRDITDPFNIDINLLEDSLEYGHLPKIEKVNDYTFIILRAFSADPNENVTTVAELSNKIAFFINSSHLLTVHRANFDFLDRKVKSYSDNEALMLDIINDLLLSYDKPIELQSEKMDEFERDIFLRNGQEMSVKALYYQKAKARISKKILLLTQNVLNQMEVKEDFSSTLQDLKDTTVSYLLHYDEIIETANSLLNAYMSVTAQKSNDVMKLLTIFSAFFLPLTFIAGLYGMNFDNIPELRWENGYFMTLAMMVLVSIIIYLWFRRKRII